MSLIQQALEKTSRAQETRTTTPLPASPKVWDRDPSGAELEQKLVQVQASYQRRRAMAQKIFLIVFTLSLMSGALVLIFRTKPAASVATPKAVPQVPVTIVSGYIYRLTGITNINGQDIAIINNRLVGVGDTLNNRATVLSIGKGAVTLDIQGKKLQLTL